MKKNQIIPYLAGAIDSDGTIGIKRSTYSMRVTRESTQPVFSERLALRQVQHDIPQLLQNKFGGSLYITKASSKNGKPLWSWAVTDLKAHKCLKALLPCLSVKKRQALNALTLRIVKEQSKRAKVKRGRGHAGAAPRPKELTDKMEALYQEAKRLNKVGL
jgi:hypothetical protein